MAGTVIPAPLFSATDGNGLPYAGGKLYSYLAGTNTPTPTYADFALTTPNTNPVVLDAAGRWPIYLGSGVYKFTLTDFLGNLIWTQDNVPALTAGGIGSDVVGLAGEALTIRNVVVLSDGSAAAGGFAATGKWVKADSNAAARSTTPAFTGIALATTAAGAAVTVRLLGVVSNFSGLTPGLTYYATDTPGGIVGSPPLNRRRIGVALSLTEMLVSSDPPALQGSVYEDPPFYFGGTSEASRAEENYALGNGYTSLVPSSSIVTFRQSQLPPGTYMFEAMLGTGDLTAVGKAQLYDLTAGVAFSPELSSVSNSYSRVGAITTINPADTTERNFGVKVKTSDATKPVKCWGARLRRFVV